VYSVLYLGQLLSNSPFLPLGIIIIIIIIIIVIPSLYLCEF